MSDIALPPILKQKHVEILLRECREHSIELTGFYAGDKSLSQRVEDNGVITRAAAHAGILNGTDPDELTPWQVAELAAEIIIAVSGALAVPKASMQPSQITPTDAASVPTT